MDKSNDGAYLTENLLKYIQEGEKLYSEALELGIAAEQSRLFLPSYGMYVRWFWTSSLQGVAHFLSQRLENDAQKENRKIRNMQKLLNFWLKNTFQSH